MAARDWTYPANSNVEVLYRWAQQLVLRLQRGDHLEHVSGSITLSGTATAVSEPRVTSSSRIFVAPRSAEALAASPYVSAVSAGVGFTVSHGSASSAAADYLVIL